MTNKVTYKITVNNLRTMDIVMLALDKLGFDVIPVQISETQWTLDIISEPEMTPEDILFLGIVIGQIEATH